MRLKHIRPVKTTFVPGSVFPHIQGIKDAGIPPSRKPEVRCEMTIISILKDFLGGISRGFSLFVTTRQENIVYSARPFKAQGPDQRPVRQ